MPFNAIIGHDQPKRFLQAAMQRDRLAHALLFHGDEGIGKRLVATVLAQAVNCEAVPPLDPPDACGVCRSCHQIEIGVHPDVTIITATSGKGETEETREIESRFIYRPLVGVRKIVILNNADLLRQEAANALLKTIEEPPPDSLIILVSGRPDSLLATIRSRCQEIRFAPLPLETVKTTLRERRSLSEADAQFLAVVSGGRLGFALEADAEALRAERAAFLQLVSRESLESIAGLFAICDAIGKSEQAEAAIGWLAAWFRDLARVKVGGDRDRLINMDRLEELDAQAARLPLERILELSTFVESMERGLDRNLNKVLLLEALLLRLRQFLQPKAA
ncbi:MAG: DNA polymerase III subunit delta' [Nitrospirae bacterium]|nr:MAG: DNA polymerase III subunit delta' [Nitrospirota bacterium]